MSKLLNGTILGILVLLSTFQLCYAEKKSSPVIKKNIVKSSTDGLMGPRMSTNRSDALQKSKTKK